MFLTLPALIVLAANLGESTSTGCRVHLVGDRELVSLIESRLEIAPIDKTKCVDRRVAIDGQADAVRISVEWGDQRMERTISDLDTAVVLIESWVHEPVEAARTPQELARSVYRVERIQVLRVEAAPVPHEVIRPVVTEDLTRRYHPVESRPVARHVTSPVVKPNLVTRRTARRPAKLQKRLVLAGEGVVGLDGEAWLGPVGEFFLTEGRWTGGVVLRYARSATSLGGEGTGWQFGGALMLGRDLPAGPVTIEPRVGFGIRRTTKNASISPSSKEQGRTDLTLHASATIVCRLDEKFDAVATTGLDVAVAAERGDSADAEVVPAAMRLSLGGRLRF